jgi:hypothetical protein
MSMGIQTENHRLTDFLPALDLSLPIQTMRCTSLRFSQEPYQLSKRIVFA